MLKKWLIAMNISDDSVNASTHSICQNHFKLSDFEENIWPGQRHRALSFDAIPQQIFQEQQPKPVISHSLP